MFFVRLVLIPPICVKVVQILSPFDVVLENTCLSFQFFPMLYAGRHRSFVLVSIVRSYPVCGGQVFDLCFFLEEIKIGYPCKIDSDGIYQRYAVHNTGIHYLW